MTRRPFKRPALVEVEWIDSIARTGWHDAGDMHRQLEDADALRHYTCGYLLRRTRDYVGIALSVGWLGSVGDVMQIPRQAIKSVTVIRKAIRD